MHGVSSTALSASNKPAVQLADQMVSDDGDQWFAAICAGLLPNDAGLQLHIQTGFEERTCYRYAAGDRKPPGYFIRALLRTDAGWQWLAALMAGSDAEWWRDLQRSQRIAEAISKIK